jgi:hypothetical protein
MSDTADIFTDWLLRLGAEAEELLYICDLPCEEFRLSMADESPVELAGAEKSEPPIVKPELLS